MTRTVSGTVIALLATAALATPTALARPADVPVSVARAAASAQAGRSADAVGFPARPVLDRPSAPTSSPRQTHAQAVTEDGIAWPTILAGMAGILVAVSAFSTIASRARHAGRASVA